MAHEISEVSGRAEFFAARTPAWHGLGTVVAEAQNASSAIKLAGLDWKVEQHPLIVQEPTGITTIQSHVLNGRRKPDGSILPLGVVGADYTPIQNDDAFGFLDKLVGEGNAVFETAGAIRDGRRVFITCKLPGDLLVGERDDRIEKYLLFANGHDGTLACRMFWTPTRVVCANTLSVALGARGMGEGVCIRHTTNALEKLKLAQQILGIASKGYDRLGEAFNLLRATPMLTSDRQAYWGQLFTEPLESAGDRSKNRHNRILGELNTAFHHERDLTGESVWGGYQAVTHYIDHEQWGHRNVSADRKMESLLFGQGHLIKRRALALAMEATPAGAEMLTASFAAN